MQAKADRCLVEGACADKGHCAIARAMHAALYHILGELQDNAVTAFFALISLGTSDNSAFR